MSFLDLNFEGTLFKVGSKGDQKDDHLLFGGSPIWRQPTRLPRRQFAGICPAEADAGPTDLLLEMSYCGLTQAILNKAEMESKNGCFAVSCVVVGFVLVCFVVPVHCKRAELPSIVSLCIYIYILYIYICVDVWDLDVQGFQTFLRKILVGWWFWDLNPWPL